MFTKALRSPQKLQVMAALLGADPVFCFPWLLKLHACASWSLSVWDHTSHHQDFLQCQRMNCTAHPYGSRVELLADPFLWGCGGR